MLCFWNFNRFFFFNYVLLFFVYINYRSLQTCRKRQEIQTASMGERNHYNTVYWIRVCCWGTFYDASHVFTTSRHETFYNINIFQKFGLEWLGSRCASSSYSLVVFNRMGVCLSRCGNFLDTSLLYNIHPVGNEVFNYLCLISTLCINNNWK